RGGAHTRYRLEAGLCFDGDPKVTFHSVLAALVRVIIHDHRRLFESFKLLWELRHEVGGIASPDLIALRGIPLIPRVDRITERHRAHKPGGDIGLDTGCAGDVNAIDVDGPLRGLRNDKVIAVGDLIVGSDRHTE